MLRNQSAFSRCLHRIDSSAGLTIHLLFLWFSIRDTELAMKRHEAKQTGSPAAQAGYLHNEDSSELWNHIFHDDSTSNGPDPKPNTWTKSWSWLWCSSIHVCVVHRGTDFGLVCKHWRRNCTWVAVYEFDPDPRARPLCFWILPMFRNSFVVHEAFVVFLYRLPLPTSTTDYANLAITKVEKKSSNTGFDPLCEFHKHLWRCSNICVGFVQLRRLNAISPPTIQCFLQYYSMNLL